MINTFKPTPNPYVKDETEANSLNSDLAALFRIGSILLANERLQVPTIEITLRLLARDSREGVRALVWELCNTVREHAENGIDFPPLTASVCDCPADHSEAMDHYNVFLSNAKADDYQGTVDYVDGLVGDTVFDVLLSWAGVPIDHVGSIRYKD